MYNVKIKDFGNGTQSRIYSRSFYSGDELKEIKERKAAYKEGYLRLQYDLYCRNNSDFDDFLTYEQFIQLKPFKDENEVSDNSQRILIQNANRAKKKIYDICRSNDWDIFVTFTFKQSDYDSSNYNWCVSTIGKWLNNLRSRKCPNLKYIVVPELHKDKIHYHFHGLLANIDGLSLVDSGCKTKDHDIIYNIESFDYGFTTATFIKSSERVSSYISKYITKDGLDLELRIKGKRHYMSSKNCNLPKVIDLNLDDVDKKEYIYNLDNITYMKTKQNFYNSVTYIESV